MRFAMFVATVRLASILANEVLFIFDRFVVFSQILVDLDQILVDTFILVDIFTLSFFHNLARAIFVAILADFDQITLLLFDTVHHLVEPIHSEAV